MPAAPARSGRPAERTAVRSGVRGRERGGERDQQRAGLLRRHRPQARAPARLGEADEQDAERDPGDQAVGQGGP
jgi:hypothetical protein